MADNNKNPQTMLDEAKASLDSVNKTVEELSAKRDADDFDPTTPEGKKVDADRDTAIAERTRLTDRVKGLGDFVAKNSKMETLLGKAETKMFDKNKKWANYDRDFVTKRVSEIATKVRQEHFPNGLEPEDVGEFANLVAEAANKQEKSNEWKSDSSKGNSKHGGEESPNPNDLGSGGKMTDGNETEREGLCAGLMVNRENFTDPNNTNVRPAKTQKELEKPVASLTMLALKANEEYGDDAFVPQTVVRSGGLEDMAGS